MTARQSVDVGNPTGTHVVALDRDTAAFIAIHPPARLTLACARRLRYRRCKADGRPWRIWDVARLLRSLGPCPTVTRPS